VREDNDVSKSGDGGHDDLTSRTQALTGPLGRCSHLNNDSSLYVNPLRHRHDTGERQPIHPQAKPLVLDHVRKSGSIVCTTIPVMEIADVKRRVIETIDRAQRRAVERRTRANAAATSYEAFLIGTAVPIVRQVANVLRAEGHPFDVFTPAGGVRLASQRGPDDYIELALDTSESGPSVVGRVRHRRGRDVVESEQRLGDPGALGEEEVLAFVLKELEPLVER